MFLASFGSALKLRPEAQPLEPSLWFAGGKHHAQGTCLDPLVIADVVARQLEQWYVRIRLASVAVLCSIVRIL